MTDILTDAQVREIETRHAERLRVVALELLVALDGIHESEWSTGQGCAAAGKCKTCALLDRAEATLGITVGR